MIKQNIPITASQLFVFAKGLFYSSPFHSLQYKLTYLFPIPLGFSYVFRGVDKGCIRAEWLKRRHNTFDKIRN